MRSGTWHVRYGIEVGGQRKSRQLSLQTTLVRDARKRRDEVFRRLRNPKLWAGPYSWQVAKPVNATVAVPAAPAPAVSAPAEAPAAATRSMLLRPLGMEGWDDLEPIVLASLAAEDPLLLVGAHGSAKSWVLERLAAVLGLTFRGYNASLLNFDDLVGIPLPDERGNGLRYVSTPTAIWDAEVVFVDELNRTRPELQNKIFPIVHERRVQGVRLERLKHRWAAINPPPRDDAESGATYLGAEPLDPALADRFAFLIEAPTWGALTKAQQRRVLLHSQRRDPVAAVDVQTLIAAARRIFLTLCDAFPPRLAEHFILLEQQRLAAKLPPLSTRRMAMLLRNTLSVQAARAARAQLDGGSAAAQATDWETSAWLAYLHGSPSLAESGSLDRAAMRAIHRHAWNLCGLAQDDPWRDLLSIGDPLDRLVRAVALGPVVGDEQLAQLVLDGIASVPVEAHRVAAALAAYLALQRRRALAGTVVESLAQRIGKVLTPGERTLELPSSQAELARQVGQLTAESSGCTERDAYTQNLLEALLPAGYAGTDPRQVRDFFAGLWDRLQIASALEVAA